MRLTPGDLAVAALTLTTGERTGRGLDKAIPTEWQFHPVRSGNAVLAAMAIARDDGARPVREDQLQLFDNLLDQVALALERGRLESEAREFTRVRERDRIRSVLVSTIGQDLKPSLEAIANAVRELRRTGSADRELISSVGSEAAKLERYVASLADLGPDSDQEPLRAGHVTIDLIQRSVSRDGIEVHLTPKEYTVLAELAKHPGRVLTHAPPTPDGLGPRAGEPDGISACRRPGPSSEAERDPSHPEIIINEPAVGYRLAAS